MGFPHCKVDEQRKMFESFRRCGVCVPSQDYHYFPIFRDLYKSPGWLWKCECRQKTMTTEEILLKANKNGYRITDG